MNPPIMRPNVVDTRASSTTCGRSYSTRGVLLPKPMNSLASLPSPSRSFSSSTSASAAVAAAIFLRNNGGKEAVAAKKKMAERKKKLTCYCTPPPLALMCPLHQFRSWPFRMLTAVPSRHFPAAAAAAGSGDQTLKKKRDVLPVVSNPCPFESYLRRKRRTKKPSRFFFEHQARVALQASDAAGSE